MGNPPPLGRQRSRQEENIYMHFMQIQCKDRKWMELAQGRVQWRALVLAELKPEILPHECYLVSTYT
jgi:hypothetical protein